MKMDTVFFKQAELLLRILPLIYIEDAEDISVRPTHFTKKQSTV